MNQMQLPSRVVDVLAALKTQGFEMKFEQYASGNINVQVYKDDRYQTSFLLVHDNEFDMLNSDYNKMCNVVDPRVQKKSAAVLKYLEGIIEY
jgi:hypothetical protein